MSRKFDQVRRNEKVAQSVMDNAEAYTAIMYQ